MDWYFYHDLLMFKNKIMKKKSLDDGFDFNLKKEEIKKPEIFEQELRSDQIGAAIKKARKLQNLTQEQLGAIVGVKKAQISKIENAENDIRFTTILKVFEALHAKVKFTIEINGQKMKIEE